MNAAPAQTTQVTVGPGLSVAAQVAVAKNPDNPVVVVDRSFLNEIGVKTTGWVHAGNTWWKEHSTQVWACVAGLDSAVAIFQPSIPPTWTRTAAAVSAIGGITGIILKYRIQFSVMADRIRAEIQRHTS